MKQKNQMCLFKVTINNNYKDSFLNYLSRLNLVHIKSKEKTPIDEKLAEKNPLIEKTKKIRDNLMNFFNKVNISESTFQELKPDPKLKVSFKINDLNELINLISEEINFYSNRYNELERYIARAIIELENITNIKQCYEFLDKFNLKRDSTTNFNQLDFKVYTTYKKNIQNLRTLFNFSEFPNIYQTSPISEDTIVFYIIYPRDKEEDLKERINIILAHEVPILKKYLTPDGINFTRIVKEIEIIENTLSKYKKERQRIRDENLHKFAGFNEVLQNIEEYNWAEQQFDEISSSLSTFQFYVPLGKKKIVEQGLPLKFKDKIAIESNLMTISQRNIDIDEDLDENTDKMITNQLEHQKGEEKIFKKENIEQKEKKYTDDTPTLTKKHLFFIRPFKSLTKMYGTPAYSEIDPTPVLAITFPLLFGLMFGDIGHGISLIIAGLIGALVFRKKKGDDFYNFCWIIFYCGFGAIFGGFLYGEFFGQHTMLGIHLIPLLQNPLDDIMLVFKFVVLIGVIHVNLGWLIQAVNYWRQKRRYMALSDSFIKILLLSGGTFLIFVWGFDIDSWFAFPFPILLPLIPGILLIVLKPLGKALGMSYLKEESYGGLMGEGSMEAFETLLSIMSNAASYIRLLALALAHLALMIAIQAMVNLIPNGGIINIIGLIFGNFIVIILEGLLAFINDIRLHFYEFFFKFYQGTGIDFFPFYLDNSYSTISFKVEQDIVLEELEKDLVSKIDKTGVKEAKEFIIKKFF